MRYVARGTATSFLFAALLLGAGPVRGQAPEIRVSVDTTVVTVGDRITMEVTVDHPAESSVAWPDSLDLGPFEILDARTSPPVPLNGIIRSSLTLDLTAFELGDLEIPSFAVGVVNPDGTSTRLATNPFGVTVTSVGLDEGGDIRALKGPMGIPASLIRALVILLAALLVMGLGYALYRRFRRRSPEAAGALPTLPRRPPHETALEALAILEASHLLEREEVKEFHIQLSDILRTYVEERFHLPALEMTSGDLLAGLDDASLGPLVVTGFRDFLEPCDMVKFAKLRPGDEASRAVLELGRQLVLDTVPAPPPTGQQSEPLPFPGEPIQLSGEEGKEVAT